MNRTGSGTSRWRRWWWVLAVVFASVWVWERFSVMRLGAEVETAQRRIVELERIRDRLLAETAILSARERIEKIAAESLGLRPTTVAQRRYIEFDANRNAAGHTVAYGLRSTD